jgi:hypothetical protein
MLRVDPRGLTVVYYFLEGFAMAAWHLGFDRLALSESATDTNNSVDSKLRRFCLQSRRITREEGFMIHIGG